MFRQALNFAGYDVREAGDGTTALQEIDRRPPDLVVLDLILPTLDGFAVHAELAARAHTRHIPVVVVTGWTRDDLDRLNVPCVLRKPVSPEELVAAVRKCLQSGASNLQSH